MDFSAFFCTTVPNLIFFIERERGRDGKGRRERGCGKGKKKEVRRRMIDVEKVDDRLSGGLRVEEEVQSKRDK